MSIGRILAYSVIHSYEALKIKCNSNLYEPVEINNSNSYEQVEIKDNSNLREGVWTKSDSMKTLQTWGRGMDKK